MKLKLKIDAQELDDCLKELLQRLRSIDKKTDLLPLIDLKLTQVLSGELPNFTLQEWLHQLS